MTIRDSNLPPGLAKSERDLLRLILLLALLALLVVSPTAKGAVMPDLTIRGILADRVGTKSGVGVVVGIIEPKGRRIIVWGEGRAFDGDTVFEIGSVTKVFTALLLADMVERRELRLTDPVMTFLPAGTRIPEHNSRAITFVDLATHTSGLPFMADGPIQPFLSRYDIRHEIGATWDYSNIGYWLLGEALTARAGRDYESLLRARITGPLKMRDTVITISPALKKRMAPGHDAALQPAPLTLTVPLYATMSAAGGLVSTANDLLTFLAAAIGLRHTPLAAAQASMLRTRRPKSASELQALGWLVVGPGEDELIFHDGGTLGYASAIAWDPKKRTGVVVLMNQIGDVSDIARHLLRPNFPLAAKPPVAIDKEIELDTAILNRYIGGYDAGEEGVFAIAMEDDTLTIESPPDWGLPKLRLHPASERAFFASEIPLRVTFETDSTGRASGILIRPPRGQQAVPATRIR